MSTKKPCPGCGEVAYGRKVDQVCNRCREAIARVKKTDEGARKSAGLTDVGFSLRAYRLPYIGHAGSDIRDAANDAFIRVVRSVGKTTLNRTVRHILKGRDGADHWEAEFRSVPDEFPDAIEALHEAVRAVAESAYLEGEQRGKSALLHLAAGDMTLGDFEEVGKGKKS